VRIDAPVLQAKFHDVFLAGLEPSRGQGVLQSQHLGVGLGEKHMHRVELLDGGQQRGIVAPHQGAFGHQRPADAPGNGGGYRGILQVQPGAGHLGLGLFQLRARKIHVLLADGLDVQHGLQPGKVLFLHRHIGLRRLGGGTKGPVVQLEQRLAGPHIGAFRKQALFHDALHARPHLRRAHRRHPARQFRGQRCVAAADVHHRHFRWRHAGPSRAGLLSGGLLVFGPTAGQDCGQHQQRQDFFSHAVILGFCINLQTCSDRKLGTKCEVSKVEKEGGNRGKIA
jgi:hypothetical protein